MNLQKTCLVALKNVLLLAACYVININIVAAQKYQIKDPVSGSIHTLNLKQDPGVNWQTGTATGQLVDENGNIEMVFKGTYSFKRVYAMIYTPSNKAIGMLIGKIKEQDIEANLIYRTLPDIENSDFSDYQTVLSLVK
jgi:hypothetical protein